MPRLFPVLFQSRKRNVCRAFLLCGCAVGLSAGAQGAGFALNESSTATVGTAFAGRATEASDASIMASNPAGLSFLNGEQWTLGGAIIATNSKLRNVSGTNPLGQPVVGDNGAPFTGTVFIPNAYYSRPITEAITVGIGAYVPFGLETDYNPDFVGRFVALKSHVQDVSFQPSVSYKLMDTVSIGMGVIIADLEGTLTQNNFTSDMKSKVTGNDWRAGVQFGALWDNGTASLGASWTSNIDFKLKGKVKLYGDNSSGSSTYLKGNGHLRFRAPQLFDFGGSYKITPDWKVLAGAQWTKWSSFKEIRVVMDQNLGTLVPAGGTVSMVPEHWKDIWMYSLGTSYQLNKEWLVRAGYAHDNTPTRDQYRTARIPDGNRDWVTIGARYTPTSKWMIDMAYGYMVPKNTDVNEQTHNSNGTTGNPTFRGRYKMGANLFMASVVHKY